MQLHDAELARAPFQCVRAAAGQQGDGDAGALSELGRQTIAHVEHLDLTPFADVRDPAVRPDAVHVGDDETNVRAAGHCARIVASPLATTGETR